MQLRKLINYYRQILLFSILIILHGCLSTSNVHDQILCEARKISQYGFLKENNGFFYLEVDYDYINRLYPLLKKLNNKIEKPIYPENNLLAHVSVIYENENPSIKVEEINKKFDFVITGIKTVTSKNIQYHMIVLESPDLEALRTKYGLTELLQGYKFHITIGLIK